MFLQFDSGPQSTPNRFLILSTDPMLDVLSSAAEANGDSTSEDISTNIRNFLSGCSRIAYQFQAKHNYVRFRSRIYNSSKIRISGMIIR